MSYAQKMEGMNIGHPAPYRLQATKNRSNDLFFAFLIKMIKVYE